METFLGLLSFAVPGILGVILGYILPRASLLKLVATGLGLGCALWILGAWLGEPSADFDGPGGLIVSAVIIVFMVALWAGGAQLGQAMRRRRARL
jgi:hypothetical protein